MPEDGSCGLVTCSARPAAWLTHIARTVNSRYGWIEKYIFNAEKETTMQFGRAQGRFMVYELVCLEWEMPRLEVRTDRSRFDLSMKAAVNASESLRGAHIRGASRTFLPVL